MEEHGGTVPTYLVGWNTLTGRSTVESGTFHRTALIVDVLLTLRHDVAGYGIRLDLGSEEQEAARRCHIVGVRGSQDKIGTLRRLCPLPLGRPVQIHIQTGFHPGQTAFRRTRSI